MLYWLEQDRQDEQKCKICHFASSWHHFAPQQQHPWNLLIKPFFLLYSFIFPSRFACTVLSYRHQHHHLARHANRSKFSFNFQLLSHSLAGTMLLQLKMLSMQNANKMHRNVIKCSLSACISNCDMHLWLTRHYIHAMSPKQWCAPWRHIAPQRNTVSQKQKTEKRDETQIGAEHEN